MGSATWAPMPHSERVVSETKPSRRKKDHGTSIRVNPGIARQSARIAAHFGVSQGYVLSVSCAETLDKLFEAQQRHLEQMGARSAPPKFDQVWRELFGTPVPQLEPEDDELPPPKPARGRPRGT